MLFEYRCTRQSNNLHQNYQHDHHYNEDTTNVYSIQADCQRTFLSYAFVCMSLLYPPLLPTLPPSNSAHSDPLYTTPMVVKSLWVVRIPLCYSKLHHLPVVLRQRGRLTRQKYADEVVIYNILEQSVLLYTVFHCFF